MSSSLINVYENVLFFKKPNPTKILLTLDMQPIEDSCTFNWLPRFPSWGGNSFWIEKDTRQEQVVYLESSSRRRQAGSCFVHCLL